MTVPRLSWFLAAILAFLPFSGVFAHPLDIAYLDIGRDGSRLTLTVAVHPYQAFELVRAGKDVRFDLKDLESGNALVAAYVADHVEIRSASGACRFEPESAHVPPTELEAVADGVTVAAALACPDTDPKNLEISSSLFLEGFPNQTSIIRLDLPDGYAERVTLDQTKRRGTIDLAELTGAASSTAEKEPQNALAALAVRAFDSDIGLWGLLGLLVSAAVIGALHAMGPGHGKALMAASLLGKHATVRRALALAGVITVTHVADVVILALIATAVSAALPIGEILRTLEIISALGLTALGAATLIRAILRYRLVAVHPELGRIEDAHARAHALGMPHSHGAPADHEHDAHHDHHHDHQDETSSFRRALWMGFLGALAPCPAAWAMFMATLASGRPSVGLMLLIAFTLGLAATLISVGILVVTSTAFAFRRTPIRVTYALPIISSLIVTGLGLVFLSRLFL